MAHENIKFNNPNLAVDSSGYFYMLDHARSLLFQKIDDGSIAFSYPLEVPAEFTIGKSLIDDVICLQFDGYNFWSLQKYIDTSGILIRRWIKEANVCRLVNQFILSNDSLETYDADTISIESYITFLTTDLPKKSTSISLNEFFDTALFQDTILNLGPNKHGQTETVTVSGVVGNQVIIQGQTQYDYYVNDRAVITPSFMIFNNYYKTDDTKGCLITFDSNTGGYLYAKEHTEYKNVTASKFTRLQNILYDYPDASTLIYVKDTNAKLMNMDELIGESTAYRGNDSFDGPSIDDIWDITSGDPSIVDGQLFMSTSGSGSDKISAIYKLIDDFDVQVSGTLGGYTVIGIDQIYHYMKVESENLVTDVNFLMSRTVYSGLDSISVLSDTGSGYTTLASVEEVTISGVTVSGTEQPNEYNFKVTRVNDTFSFLYEHTTSSGWQTLYSTASFDTEVLISLGLHSLECTVSGAYFDNFSYNKGRLVNPTPDVAYYGILNMDNVRDDQSTIIPVYDIDVVGDNLYRLQDEATYYGTDNSWSSYNYQISPIRHFIDFITVDAENKIVPATGRNLVAINSVTLDQYGQGVVYKPITFTDDDPIGFITRSIVYTYLENTSGEADTTYMSGLDLRDVEIVAEATQYD